MTRPEIPRPASRRGWRARPESTTRRTPETVREDSARDVLTTIRGGSPGAWPATARSCSRGVSWPCSSRTSTPGLRSSAATRETSRAPGRKTRASTAGSCARARRCASAVVRATWERNAGVTPRSSRRCGPGCHMTSSGCSADGQSTTGAGSSPPSSAAKRAASTVADIATTVRSSRSCRSSASMPTSRSDSTPRSCTSSSTTAAVPGSSGSASRRRSRMPGVTNSTRVRALTSRSPRTLQPTTSPGRVPLSAASRRAAARAATRRGWTTTTRPGAAASPATNSATTGGTTVVLPVPGGACTTATPPCRAWRSCGTARAKGRSRPIRSRSKKGMAPVSRRAPTRSAQRSPASSAASWRVSVARRSPSCTDMDVSSCSMFTHMVSPVAHSTSDSARRNSAQ